MVYIKQVYLNKNKVAIVCLETKNRLTCYQFFYFVCYIFFGTSNLSFKFTDLFIFIFISEFEEIFSEI